MPTVKTNKGEKYKTARMQKGLSRAMLAKQAGVKEHQIQYLEQTGSFGNMGPALASKIVSLIGGNPDVTVVKITKKPVAKKPAAKAKKPAAVAAKRVTAPAATTPSVTTPSKMVEEKRRFASRILWLIDGVARGHATTEQAVVMVEDWVNS